MLENMLEFSNRKHSRNEKFFLDSFGFEIFFIKKKQQENEIKFLIRRNVYMFHFDAKNVFPQNWNLQFCFYSFYGPNELHSTFLKCLIR